MKNPCLAIGLILVTGLLFIAGCASNQNPTTTTSTSETTTTIANSPLLRTSQNPLFGEIITDAYGMTLYVFSGDEPGKSNCYNQCESNWPPAYVPIEGPLTVAPELSDSIGTAVRADGKKQFTYKNAPLYRYAQDKSIGDARGEGVGGMWLVATVEPRAVTTTTVTTTRPAQSTTTYVTTTTVSVGKTYSVEISGFAFNPSTLSIKRGDTVVWTNKDNVPHRIASDAGSELASNTLGAGQTYSHTFQVTGDFNYHCTVHPSMKGTISVNSVASGGYTSGY